VLHQRHTGGKSRRQRARPARHRSFHDQFTNHRRLEHHPVDDHLNLRRTPPRLQHEVAGASEPNSMTYQYLTKKSDIAITINVGAGRSAPKLENTLLNAGITKIMMIAVIRIDTSTIIAG